MTLVALVAACSLDNPGTDPPSGRLHFPIALEVDDTRLFVASSDFDLRYNGGIISAFELARIDAAIEAADASSGCTGAAPCTIEDIAPLLAQPGAEVKVGAFAIDLALSTQRRRMFALVRGDGAVVSIDLDRDGRAMSCFSGSPSGAARCSGRYLRGKTADQTERRIVLPAEPQSLVVVPLAGDGEPEDPDDPDSPPAERQALVVAHSTGGRASLFLDRKAEGESVLPTLVHVLDGMSDGATVATYDRATGLVAVANRANPVVERIGIADDPNIARSYLFRGGDVSLQGVNTGRDARGMIFEPDGSRAYVVQRSPGSLMRIDLRTPRFESALELCPGASLMTERTGELPDGSVRRRFYVTCYDAQQIFVVDPELGEVVNVIRTGGGPHELVFDPRADHPRAYLADFRDSVIRVISLDPSRPETFERVIAILGEIRTVRGLD